MKAQIFYLNKSTNTTVITNYYLLAKLSKRTNNYQENKFEVPKVNLLIMQNDSISECLLLDYNYWCINLILQVVKQEIILITIIIYFVIRWNWVNRKYIVTEWKYSSKNLKILIYFPPSE